MLFPDSIVKIPEDLDVFAGHFPSFPMLPGIYSIQIALKHLEEKLQHRIKLHSIQRCKFHQPLLPGMVARIESKLGSKTGNVQNATVLLLSEDKLNAHTISEVNLVIEISYE